MKEKLIVIIIAAILVSGFSLIAMKFLFMYRACERHCTGRGGFIPFTCGGHAGKLTPQCREPATTVCIYSIGICFDDIGVNDTSLD